MTLTEADTCRMYILPKLRGAGWQDNQISEQKTITDGKILVVGNKIIRRKQKRVDYLLRYQPDIMLGVVEAKAFYKKPADGLQQAKEYAQMLDLKFAYSSNGEGIVEHNFLTGLDANLDKFPTPVELWQRLLAHEKLTAETDKIATPLYHFRNKSLRYYQEIAINRTVNAILQRQPRVLLTMATGTGKTTVAFEIIWKLWNSRWNKSEEHRRPRVLFLADRNILVDDPMEKEFLPFGDARKRIQGDPDLAHEIYFATYQSLAKDERRPGLYRQYPRDFFDLIVVDECHRGSASDESNWREILEYFKSSYQLGMTATPLRDDNKDTYRYFGNPVYTYSLKQGINDGFLSPYKVYRIIPNIDATGWTPVNGQRDRYGREIPKKRYGTSEYERTISFIDRTKAIAKNITEFLKRTDRFAKTIIFCVDMEHAEMMRMALNNLNADLVRQHPNYVARIVSEEGVVGRGLLYKFQDLEQTTPVIVTTSQLLTTGVDVPLCKNIVLARVINSMTDFKQIIGRGTRLREDYGKLYFNILDYTSSATRLFADPQFDGEPALLTEEEMTAMGDRIEGTENVLEAETADEEAIEIDTGIGGIVDVSPDNPEAPKKFYVDDVRVKIVAELAYELDPDGNQLRVIKYTDYTREKVRMMFTKAADLRSKWSDPDERAIVMAALEERGISLEKLMEVTKLFDTDRFDLLCHIAFNTPLRTRRERAESLRKEKKDFFENYSFIAREILNEILDKYIEFGIEQFRIPDILKVAPIDRHGNVMEIADIFGGTANLRQAVYKMQQLLYE